MKELTVIRNSIMKQLPKKDGLILTNLDKPHRKLPLPHQPRSAQSKKRKQRPSMKAKAWMLTGIPKDKGKNCHPKPSDAAGSQWNSTISHKSAYECQQPLHNVKVTFKEDDS